jgi:hypothetical protein
MPHAISIEATAAGLNQFATRFGPRINSLMRQGLEFERELPFVGADYAYTGQDVAVGDILQPYQSGFTPNNTENFDGIDNFLRPIKADLQFTAEQLEKFFSRWKYDWFTPDAADIERGYSAYMINQVIMPKLLEELNLASWAGDYVAPTPGTPGAVLESVDGFAKNIMAQVTANRLSEIGTGVLVASTMVAQVREFCNEVPQPYRYKSGKIFMSKTRAQEYSDQYKLDYKLNSAVIESADGLRLRVDDYNKTIVGITAMEGSDRIILVIDNEPSMIIGTREGYPQYFQFRFQQFDRTLKCMAEIYRFYGFETCLHMFVNDQV